MTQRFTVRRQLTFLVGKGGWVIYRDSVNGMYALNRKKGIDLPLMFWNITLNDPNLDKIVEIIRRDIEEAERA